MPYDYRRTEGLDEFLKKHIQPEMTEIERRILMYEWCLLRYTGAEYARNLEFYMHNRERAGL
jgi:hypothetical protein